MPFPDVVTPAARAALADVRFTPYWLDQPSRPAARPALVGDVEADLVVIGGGLSGLWTAYEARRRFPDWSVILLEGQRIAEAASGRNGGYVAGSLAHANVTPREALAEKHEATAAYAVMPTPSIKSGCLCVLESRLL